MNRNDFLQLLARAVRDSTISEDEAVRLLLAFDAGEIDPTEDDLPLPVSEAVAPVDENFIRDAVAALATLGTLVALHFRRERVRETLQDRFQSEAASLAKRYATNGALRDWHADFRDLVSTNIIQQRAVGGGRVPAPTAVNDAILEQSAFASRFAEQVGLKALLDEPPSYWQRAARSSLYAGAGRAEGYKAEAELYPEDGAVTYTATDDAGTCQSCLDAEGTYSVSEPFPTPGDVCEGFGNCRCTLEFTEVAA
jgi:hypothetical protein